MSTSESKLAKTMIISSLEIMTLNLDHISLHLGQIIIKDIYQIIKSYIGCALFECNKIPMYDYKAKSNEYNTKSECILLCIDHINICRRMISELNNEINMNRYCSNCCYCFKHPVVMLCEISDESYVRIGYSFCSYGCAGFFCISKGRKEKSLIFSYDQGGYDLMINKPFN